MIYFSGFSLKDEQELFKEFLINREFTVAGFSYGAIKAFEYSLKSKNRINRLILLSPALFQEESKAFKKTQLRYFKLDRERYIKNFLKNVVYPSNINLEKYLTVGSYNELKLLLNYVWDIDKIEELKKSGVEIEVFIGGRDKIINPKTVSEFFSKITTTYLLKDKGHILI